MKNNANNVIDEITIDNVFNIKKASIPITKSGVILLTGHNGAGKDNAIDAVNALISGEGKLEVRRGESIGLIRGLGVTLVVGRTSKRSGELVVEEIASRFDIGIIIDPGIKDEYAADSARIKSLLKLLGIEPNPEYFYEIIGSKEEFEEIVPVSKLDTGDIVSMAGQIKREIERVARTEETRSKELHIKVKALRDVAEGIDVSQEHDEIKLRQQYEHAVASKAQLVATKSVNEQILQNATAAKIELKRLGESDNVLSIDDAEKFVAAAEIEVENKRATFEKAKSEFEAATMRREHAKKDLQHAKQMKETLQTWQKQIAAAENVQAISDEELKAAFSAVDIAQAATTTGVLIRKALESLKQADAENEKYKTHSTRAEKLRDAASNIDNILSSLINVPQLKVQQGRLFARNSKNEVEFFDKLSQGEKWKTIVEVAAPVVKKLAKEHGIESGMITAPQIAWEGLQPKNQDYVLKLCIDNDVLLLSAHNSDGELKAEIFQGNSKPKKSK